jgi:hypothetical protein
MSEHNDYMSEVQNNGQAVEDLNDLNLFCNINEV